MPADLQSALVGRLSIPAQALKDNLWFSFNAPLEWIQSTYADWHYYLSLPRVKICDFDEQKGAIVQGCNVLRRGADERIRTADPLFTKQPLWPTELRRREIRLWL